VEGLRLFGVLAVCFVALLAAIVIAGFLDQALGLSATVIWGLAVIGLIFLLASRDAQSSS
jgi:MFS-type transporter involved in bile tolerance (Atg22 family)